MIPYPLMKIFLEYLMHFWFLDYQFFYNLWDYGFVKFQTNIIQQHFTKRGVGLLILA